jgi:medium-chain acyl-[acyl-carrier-protein] hydrolase
VENMSIGTKGNLWVPRFRSNASALLRLFCLPYAGGGAAVYRTWGDVLPRSVEVCPVQLPGREMRLKERAFSSVFPLVEAMAPALVPLLDKPFVLFGHSMGALVAFELANRLRRDHNLLPEVLFVSARVAPSAELRRGPLSKLPDDELMEEILGLNGTDKNLLDHKELLRLTLPTLRADLALHEDYKYSEEPPLQCPIVAFGGLRDPKIDAEGLEGWRNHTSSSFARRLLAGDHFFISAPHSSFLNVFALELQRVVATLGSRSVPAHLSKETPETLYPSRQR